MPDVVTEGPFVDLLRAMGAQGVQDRHEASGGAVPCSVCLFHGVHGAQVHWQVAVPMLGGRTVGRPVVLVHVVVACWPQCGYKLEWRHLPG